MTALRAAVLLAFAAVMWVATPPTPPAVAAPVPKAIKQKSPALDGRWQIVEMNSYQQDLTAQNPWVWDIDGETVTTRVRDKEGGLSLHDPRTAVTLVRPTGGGADEVDHIRDDGTPMRFPGRLKVDGDELVLCFVNPDGTCPDELKPGRAVYYYRFKRVNPK